MRLAGEADAFADDDGSVHEDDINALAAIEVIKGRADGTVDADANVRRAEVAATRAQFASMITRMLSTPVSEGVVAPPV